jgi:hypothetical protein
MHLGYRSAEYNSRSKYKRSEVFETIHNASKGNTLINNKIHLRFELTGVEAYQECLEYIEKGFIQMLSIMDHTPGRGQHTKEWFMKMVLANGKTEEQGLEELNERLNRPLIDGEELEKMIKLAKEIAINNQIDIKEGIYICVTGPTFETNAEYKMIKAIGGDAVGMSTVQEVIAAVHMGLKCFAVSVITDKWMEEHEINISHEEVLNAAKEAEPKLTKIFKELIQII